MIGYRTISSIIVKIALLLSLTVAPISAYASGNDPALNDKNRVKTLEEVEAKAKEVMSGKKSAQLCNKLRAILEKYPNSTPLRDALQKALEEVNCSSDEDVYQKIRQVLLKFPDEKSTDLYKDIRDALREYKPLTRNTSYMPCQVTPKLSFSFTPKKDINKNGNLMRKEGAVKRAMGQYMQLKGKLLDEQCVPIENAVIEIWQTDNAGKNEDEYQIHSEWDVKDPNYDKNFAYTGTVQTNNLGEFSLLTIFPGIMDTKAKEAPHLNVRIIHPDFEELNTRIYFAKHPRNELDEILQSLTVNTRTGTEDQRGLVTAVGRPIDANNEFEGRIFYHRMVMRGIDPYSEF